MKFSTAIKPDLLAYYYIFQSIPPFFVIPFDHPVLSVAPGNLSPDWSRHFLLYIVPNVFGCCICSLVFALVRQQENGWLPWRGCPATPQEKIKMENATTRCIFPLQFFFQSGFMTCLSLIPSDAISHEHVMNPDLNNGQCNRSWGHKLYNTCIRKFLEEIYVGLKV